MTLFYFYNYSTIMIKINVKLKTGFRKLLTLGIVDYTFMHKEPNHGKPFIRILPNR